MGNGRKRAFTALQILLILACIGFSLACAGLPLFVSHNQESLWVGTDNFMLELGPASGATFGDDAILIGVDWHAHKNTCREKNPLLWGGDIALRFYDCT